MSENFKFLSFNKKLKIKIVQSSYSRNKEDSNVVLNLLSKLSLYLYKLYFYCTK